MLEEDTQLHFYWFCMTRDLTNWDATDRPSTPIMEELRADAVYMSTFFEAWRGGFHVVDPDTPGPQHGLDIQFPDLSPMQPSSYISGKFYSSNDIVDVFRAWAAEYSPRHAGIPDKTLWNKLAEFSKSNARLIRPKCQGGRTSGYLVLAPGVSVS